MHMKQFLSFRKKAMKASNIHWNGNVILLSFPSLATPEFVKSKTISAASDKIFIKMKIFQCDYEIFLPNLDALIFFQNEILMLQILILLCISDCVESHHVFSPQLHFFIITLHGFRHHKVHTLSLIKSCAPLDSLHQIHNTKSNMLHMIMAPLHTICIDHVARHFQVPLESLLWQVSGSILIYIQYHDINAVKHIHTNVEQSNYIYGTRYKLVWRYFKW